jgi:hypothetical protein
MNEQSRILTEYEMVVGGFMETLWYLPCHSYWAEADCQPPEIDGADHKYTHNRRRSCVCLFMFDIMETEEESL